MADQNYTLGRGEVFLSLFKPDTFVPIGERYIGNTPTFSINVEATNLDHFSSDRGVREKDDSIVNQVNRTATCVTDSIQPENVGLFFFGEAGTVTQVAAANQTDTFENMVGGLFYQLGTNAQRPQGVRSVSSVVVTPTGAGAVAAVLGTDYNLDNARGRIEVIPGGALSGKGATVTYSVGESKRDRIISGNKPVSGQLRYIAQNPKGKKFDYFMPYVTVRPNGDYALKGDEWQQLPLTIEILKLGTHQAVYVDGLPYIS